jgi:hypothetical protein
MDRTYPVRQDCPRDQVEELIDQLLLKYEQYGRASSTKDFPTALYKDLADSDYQSITAKTYAQLSRWCYPERWSEREMYVRGIAIKLSKMLFGDVIPRVQGSP